MHNQHSIFQLKKSTKRILIIEQSESLGLLYKSILLQKRYTISIASSGKEALNMLESFQPDLIITMDKLSDMSSNQLRKRVTAAGCRTYRPILVLSDNEKTLFSSATHTANADEVLLLPFRAKEFRNSVRRLVGVEQSDDKHFYYPNNLHASYQQNLIKQN